MDKITKEQVKNFPLDNERARISLIDGKYYVVVREHYFDKTLKASRTKTQYLGRIVDLVYYSMEEYHQKFKRNGQLRTPVIPTSSADGAASSTDVITLPKKRIRPTKRRVKNSIVDLAKVKNFPDNPYLKIVKKGEHIYVIESEHYIKNGKRCENRRYVGKIVKNRFYTMEEYKQTFKRDGSLKDPKVKAKVKAKTTTSTSQVKE